MKKIIIILLILAVNACTYKRDIKSQPENFIEIHGKVYKLVRVVPKGYAHPIWIMYPKDSADEMPSVLNFTTQAGKATINQTLIKID